MTRNGWANVLNGQVASTAAGLPTVWGNVTGFDMADEATAAANGWLPLYDDQPDVVAPGQVLAGPTYAVSADRVTATYSARQMTPAELAAPRALALSAKLQAIDAEFRARVAAGWSYTPPGATAPVTIDIDDGSRANLSGLVSEGILVVLNAATWDLAQGWVARGGTRIPMATPQDAFPLARGAAGYYSSLVQHEQDLCDLATAAPDAAGVTAVDQTAGWPT